MSKATKRWLVTAASLVFIGCVGFTCVMSQLKWDFTKLSTVKYETNTHKITKEFDGISIITDTADIQFALSDDEKCRVECYEQENAKHAVTVEKGILTVTLIDERSVSDFIGFIGINVGSPKIRVHLPKAEYTSLFIDEDTGDINIPKNFQFENVDISTSTGDVKFCASAAELIKIKTSTGDIDVENISADIIELAVSTGTINVTDAICEGDMTVGVSTGKAFLTDIACENVISNGSTGDLILKNVVAVERISIKRSTGDITFDKCDADEITVLTDTGDVAGSLLTDKVFITETSTGRIDVPKTTNGGRCEIRTNTGDIKMEIK